MGTGNRAVESELRKIKGPNEADLEKGLWPEADFAAFGIDTTIELTRDIVKGDNGIYALEARGNSMIDARVNDGDIVLMRHQQSVENGELAAVWLRDREETTLKRFFLEGSQVRLQPDNPTLDAMYFPVSNVKVVGKVVCIIRQLN